MSICYQCGKPLVDGVNRPVQGVERNLHGNHVLLHQVCSKSFDKDNRHLTASETPRDEYKE